RDPAENGLQKRPLDGRRLESLESCRSADDDIVEQRYWVKPASPDQLGLSTRQKRGRGPHSPDICIRALRDDKFTPYVTASLLLCLRAAQGCANHRRVRHRSQGQFVS